MATANDILTMAKSFIGTKESPSGSNNVIFNTHYYGREVTGSSYAWCCTFVWDIFRLCGASSLFYDGKKTAYCPNLQAWADTRGLTVGKSKGQAGDIILFDWNNNNLADHVGIILSKNSNGTYTTIEGNTSIASNDNGGNVMRRTRKQREVLMIIRPKYDTTKNDKVMKMFTYKNKTGTEIPVYADSNLKTKIGSLNAGATCSSFGTVNGRTILYYRVLSTGIYKIGFTDRTEGLE